MKIDFNTDTKLEFSLLGSAEVEFEQKAQLISWNVLRGPIVLEIVEYGVPGTTFLREVTSGYYSLLSKNVVFQPHRTYKFSLGIYQTCMLTFSSNIIKAGPLRRTCQCFRCSYSIDEIVDQQSSEFARGRLINQDKWLCEVCKNF